ncbi:unnamed protein product [Mucor hiemalis]
MSRSASEQEENILSDHDEYEEDENDLYNDAPREIIDSIPATKITEAKPIISKDCFLNDAFIDSSPVRMTSRANKVILAVLEKVSSSSLKYQLDASVVKNLYEKNLRQATRSTFIFALGRQMDAYDFKIDDATSITTCSAYYLSIVNDGRFLRKNFSRGNNLFTSTFFLAMYEKIYFQSRITLQETNTYTMSLLTVGIMHLLNKLCDKLKEREIQEREVNGRQTAAVSSNPALTPTSPPNEDANEEVETHQTSVSYSFNASNKSPWPTVYNDLLNIKDEITFVHEDLNFNRKINWPVEIASFIIFYFNSLQTTRDLLTETMLPNLFRKSKNQGVEYDRYKQTQS